MNILKITYKSNNYHRNFDVEIESLLTKKWGLVPFGSNADIEYRRSNERDVTRYYSYRLKESDTINDASMHHFFQAVEDIKKCWNSMMWKKNNKNDNHDPFEPWADWDGSDVGDTPRNLTEYINVEVLEVNRKFYVM